MKKPTLAVGLVIGSKIFDPEYCFWRFFENPKTVSTRQCIDMAKDNVFLSKNQVKLSDLSEKDKKWDSKKLGAQVVEKYYLLLTQYQKKAAKMRDCSRFLSFDVFRHKQTGKKTYRLAAAHFCHNRFCEICMWRRSLKNTAKFLAKLPEIIEKYPSPKHEWCFLTLTIPNVQYENTRESIKAMNIAFRRLIKREEFKNAVDGWVKTTEVTNEKTRTGYAHPHFHVLLLMKPWYFKKSNYITQARWLELWQEATRDETITQADIRKIKPNKKIEGQTLTGAVLETLKYGIKPADIKDSKDFLYAMTKQLHKSRFVDSGGALKGILKNEKLTDEELVRINENKEIENQGEMEKSLEIFKWNGANYVKH